MYYTFKTLFIYITYPILSPFKLLTLLLAWSVDRRLFRSSKCRPICVGIVWALIVANVDVLCRRQMHEELSPHSCSSILAATQVLLVSTMVAGEQGATLVWGVELGGLHVLRTCVSSGTASVHYAAGTRSHTMLMGSRIAKSKSNQTRLGHLLIALHTAPRPPRIARLLLLLSTVSLSGFT